MLIWTLFEHLKTKKINHFICISACCLVFFDIEWYFIGNKASYDLQKMEILKSVGLF